MDDFAAIERWLQNRFSVDMESGIVRSVDSTGAQVEIGGGTNTQRCSLSPNTVVSVGDEVVLVRSRRNPHWSISSVIGQSGAGSTFQAQHEPNNVPGSPRWAKVNSNPTPSGHSFSATALTVLMSGIFTFSGGRPAVIAQGYAVPGASDVGLRIGWGLETGYKNLYRATVKSTTSETDWMIFDVYDTPIVGKRTVTVQGQLSAGTAITLNYTRFLILEL